MKAGFPLTEKTEKRTVCEDRISVSIKTKDRFDKSPTTHAIPAKVKGFVGEKGGINLPLPHLGLGDSGRNHAIGAPSGKCHKWKVQKINPKVDSI